MLRLCCGINWYEASLKKVSLTYIYVDRSLRYMTKKEGKRESVKMIEEGQGDKVSKIRDVFVMPSSDGRKLL